VRFARVVGDDGTAVTAEQDDVATGSHGGELDDSPGAKEHPVTTGKAVGGEHHGILDEWDLSVTSQYATIGS